MSLKIRKMKFRPRIKLSHSVCVYESKRRILKFDIRSDITWDLIPGIPSLFDCVILMVLYYLFRTDSTVLGCAGFHGDCLALTKLITARLQVLLANSKDSILITRCCKRTLIFEETWYTGVTSQEVAKSVIRSGSSPACFHGTMLRNTAIEVALPITELPKLDK